MPDAGPHELTQLLIRAERGDALASEALLPLLYDELRSMAKGCFRRQTPAQTLQPAFVAISGTLSSDFEIALSSDDSTEATVPATIVIPAGQTSAVFDVTIIAQYPPRKIVGTEASRVEDQFVRIIVMLRSRLLAATDNTAQRRNHAARIAFSTHTSHPPCFIRRRTPLPYRSTGLAKAFLKDASPASRPYRRTHRNQNSGREPSRNSSEHQPPPRHPDPDASRSAYQSRRARCRRRYFHPAAR